MCRLSEHTIIGTNQSEPHIIQENRRTYVCMYEVIRHPRLHHTIAYVQVG